MRLYSRYWCGRFAMKALIRDVITMISGKYNI